MPNSSYAREYAIALVSNLDREAYQKKDYWVNTTIDLITAGIWYLKSEQPNLCDLPHLFALLRRNDIENVLELMQSNLICKGLTSSLYSAVKLNAQGQTAGVLGTLKTLIGKVNTPEIMELFYEDEVPLDVNNIDNPIYLTIGTNPTLSNVYAPLCALIISVATRMMNKPGQNKSFVMIDELPTLFLPNIEQLPNTARSNKVATILMCQDIAQINDAYGVEKSKILFASCATQFYGQVSTHHTAEQLSKQFGKADKMMKSDSFDARSFLDRKSVV